MDTEDNVPQNENGFDQMRVDPNTIARLNKKRMKEMFPCQSASFDSIYDGENVLINDKSGNGKTHAYLIPLIERLSAAGNSSEERKPKVVIIANSRARVDQIKFEIRSLLHDENRFLEYSAKLPELPKDILSTQLNQLSYLLQENPEQFSEVETVVFDKADILEYISKDKETLEYLTELELKLNKKPQYVMVSNLFNEVLPVFDSFFNGNYKYFNFIEEYESSLPSHIRHHYALSEGLWNDFNTIAKNILFASFNSKKCIIFMPNESN